MVSLYLDISVVRIQHYLSRTPQLKGRRGASAAIKDATQLKDDAPVLQGRARINREAGEADGVVNLLLDIPDDSAPDAAEDTALALARDVLSELRRDLPGAEFQADWGTGPFYLQEHHDTIGPRLARGEVLSDLPPAPEFPYATGCRICHQDPATGRLTLGPEERDIAACADCRMRYSGKARTAGGKAENDLTERLGVRRKVEGLDELAALGGPGTDRNHVSTVFIDGNAFGEFFHHLAQHRDRLDADAKTRISADLNEHTRTALQSATRAVRQASDGDLLCVVPHLVGGDDVLVSLPADRAWRFTRHYLTEFGRLVEQTRRQAGVPDLPPLSASAGLVFAHATHAFELAVQEAEARLRTAKAMVGGQQASVDFTDLTIEGPGRPMPPPLTLATLDAEAAHLRALARLPVSLRTKLAGQLRDSTSRERRARVDNTVNRLGYRQVIAPFWDEGDTGAEPDIPLEQALRLVRWWQ